MLIHSHRLRGRGFAKTLLCRITSDKRFEPVGGSNGTAGGTPKQTLVYITNIGGCEYSYVTSLDLNARGRYNIGGGELFDTKTNGQRLSVRVLNFDRWDQETHENNIVAC